MKNVKAHAVKETAKIKGQFSKNIEEIKRNGFTIYPNAIEPNDLAIIRKKIKNIYEIQVDEIGGEENLDIIHDQGFVMSLLSYDNFFVDFAVGNKCLKFADYFLGSYYQLFCQNGVINQSNRSSDQIINMWHRDLNYLHFTTSKPFGINIFFCIDDFTPENGATYMLPGSHRFEEFPGIEFAEQHKVQLEAKAGSALVFDAMIFHRAGRNTSDKSRVTMTNIYTYPFMKQQIDLPYSISDYIGNNEMKRKILGFENKTLPNVREFRKLRLDRKNKSK